MQCPSRVNLHTPIQGLFFFPIQLDPQLGFNIIATSFGTRHSGISGLIWL